MWINLVQDLTFGGMIAVIIPTYAQICAYVGIITAIIYENARSVTH